MDTRTYWALVLRNARAKTLTHILKKMLLGLVVAVIVAGAQYLLRLRNLSDTSKIVISIAAGYGGVGLFFFLKHVVTEPARLHAAIVESSDTQIREMRESSAVESSTLKKRIEQLTPPKRTHAEQHHYEAARAALEQLSELRADIPVALHHLRMHDTLTFGGPMSPPLPAGMSVYDLKGCLTLCVEKSLVTRKQGENRSGGAYPVYDEIYTIAPGLKAALDELLYAPMSP